MSEHVTSSTPAAPKFYKARGLFEARLVVFGRDSTYTRYWRRCRNCPDAPSQQYLARTLLRRTNKGSLLCSLTKSYGEAESC